MTTLSTISQGATLTIEPDELLGLTALAELDNTDGGKADAVPEARTLMRRALADKLAETGLPWAPSPEVLRQRAETRCGCRTGSTSALAGASCTEPPSWPGSHS